MDFPVETAPRLARSRLHGLEGAYNGEAEGRLRPALPTRVSRLF